MKQFHTNTMSDWHGSDSPSKSWSFRRSNSPAHMLCDDQDSESALDMFMDAGYANVNGDDWVYQVRTPPFFATSPPAFPSYAEDSFAELPVCTCITETDPAPFSQESAMIGCFAEIQLSAGAFHDKENLMAAESSAMRSFGGSAHALQPHLEVLGVPAPSDGQGFGTDSISEPTVLDHASASGNRSCRVVLAPSLKEQLFGPIRARVDVHSAQVSGCSRTGALPDVVILRSCGSERGKTMQQRLNPLGRQSDDVETSDPIARSHAAGAIKNANLTLVTRADCTGFSWSVKIRFSTKLHNQKVEFGTQNPKALHQKKFEFWLTAQNMSTGGSEDFKFAGRLMNSNKKKPNPDWLILHFMGIKNDDLPHVNCAARHVRQFVDHAVLKEAQEAHVAAVLPTYQLLFHGSIQYEHAHFQMDDDAAETLKKMCAESAALSTIRGETDMSTLVNIAQQSVQETRLKLVSI